jgi:predicted  nucleic acid-binding Zn-ribbon protein
MQMFLKQLGIEPEKILKDVETLKNTFEQLEKTLERIELKVDALSTHRLTENNFHGHDTSTNNGASGNCG